MLAFFSNLHPFEMGVVLFVALLIFGGRLPEVVMDLAKRVYKLRAMLTNLRKESGLDDELRNLKRTVREAEYEVRRQAERTGETRPLTPTSGPTQLDEAEGGEAPDYNQDPTHYEDHAHYEDPAHHDDPAHFEETPLYEKPPVQPSIATPREEDAEAEPEAGGHDDHSSGDQPHGEGERATGA